MRLHNGDCLEVLRTIPDKSVDLVLTDPPYNIGIMTKKAGKKTVNQWDKIPNYIEWCVSWLQECQRVLKPTGVLYFWHNDMAQIAQLLEAIRQRTTLAFVSFCVWDKGNTYRAKGWVNRDPNGKIALRSWFNICEYCLHFFNAPKEVGTSWRRTGQDRINSSLECYKPLKDWYRAELERLGITERDIARKYAESTGRNPYTTLKHYFRDSQFNIPTEAVWEAVYEPLGFGQSYEELRQSYEDLRNVHHCDAMHCNVWHVPPVPNNKKRLHTCQKPVALLERMIQVSSNPGGLVLDCFMGSGSTGVACVNTGRDFIGIELDKGYFEAAKSRIQAQQAQTKLGEDVIKWQGIEEKLT